MEILKINNVIFKVDGLQVLNFNSLSEIPFEVEEKEEFLNTSGLIDLHATLYTFKSDHPEYDCFNVERNGDIYLANYEVERELNELEEV